MDAKVFDCGNRVGRENEQMGPLGKWQNTSYRQGSRIKAEDLLLTQSRSICAKDRSRPELCVIQECTIRRRRQTVAHHNPPRISAQRWHRPRFVPAKNSAVIDFGSVGRKAGDNLVGFIVGKLQRFAARGQHDKNLRDSPHR